MVNKSLIMVFGQEEAIKFFETNWDTSAGREPYMWDTKVIAPALRNILSPYDTNNLKDDKASYTIHRVNQLYYVYRTPNDEYTRSVYPDKQPVQIRKHSGQVSFTTFHMNDNDRGIKSRINVYCVAFGLDRKDIGEIDIALRYVMAETVQEAHVVGDRWILSLIRCNDKNIMMKFYAVEKDPIVAKTSVILAKNREEMDHLLHDASTMQQYGFTSKDCLKMLGRPAGGFTIKNGNAIITNTEADNGVIVTLSIKGKELTDGEMLFKLQIEKDAILFTKVFYGDKPGKYRSFIHMVTRVLYLSDEDVRLMKLLTDLAESYKTPRFSGRCDLRVGWRFTIESNELNTTLQLRFLPNVIKVQGDEYNVAEH